MGTERSFEWLYRAHRRAVYGSVLRDVRDPDEAEDVTQAAFVNAFRALLRGDEPERPRAWLLTIARNVVRRRAAVRANRPQEVELDPELALAGDDDGPTAGELCAVLRGLPENQRRAIVLREVQGRSYAEIAGALGLSLPAVEALIFRARRALSAELEGLERAPVVRSKKRGLFALPLPGFAKLGSLGLSLGRAGATCAVGCALVAVVPVGESGANREPAVRLQRPPAAREAAGTPTSVALGGGERVGTAKPAPHRKPHAAPVSSGATRRKPAPANLTQDDQLVPVGLAAVVVPAVNIPGVELPDVSPPVTAPGLPAVPLATS